ncbi:MAG: AsmA-like C-terminal domain-containing protein, partial [Deltaproteobacteria bacterium]|nr:AsmA-like C-terminal domain-containing protein [Deltaproteobacteria bacterium]
MLKKFIKTIIYFFVAVVLSAGLTIAGLALFLHQGIHVERFSWKNIQLENCSIVWDKKIRVSLETLNITPDGTEKSSFPGVTDIRSYLMAGKYAGPFIAEINITHLKFKDFSGALKYTGWSDEAPGVIHLLLPDITLDVTVQHDGRDFVLGINELSSKRYISAITGSARITDEPLVTGQLLADIAGKLPLRLTFSADNKGLSFASDKPVTIDSIKPVVDLFQLGPVISPWISEYLKGSSFQLTHLEGMLLWGDPASFLDSLLAKVRVQDCDYTFSQGLQSIQSEYTDLVFQKNVLNIYPHNAVFYGQDCEKIWGKIDFTEPAEPILTVSINTQAVINDDIINLLDHYRITLPFKQLEGTTAVDLVLEINLATINLDATGTFKVDQSVFGYEGTTLDISDCVVLLKNRDITIQHMQVTEPEVFSGKVNGHIALSKRYGDIFVTVVDSRFKAGDSEIKLYNGTEPLSYIYHIRPDGDSLESTASSWQVDTNVFHLSPFTAPFNPRSQIISLPPTSVTTSKSQSDVMISGDINLKERTVDLLLDYYSYKRGNLELAQPHLNLEVQINNGLKIHSRKTSKWLINNIATTISPNEILYRNNKVTIHNGHLTYGDFFEGSVHGSFNLETRKGSFVLSKLNLKNDTIGTLLRDYDGFKVLISGDEKGVEFDIPLLDATIKSGKDGGWQVSFRDLGKLAGRFPFLKRYHITDGTLSFGSKNGGKPYNFQGTVTYPYSVFVVNGTPVNKYNFSGTIGEKRISAQVIDKFKITIDKKIILTSDNIEYNIVELVKLLKNLSKANSASSMKDSSKKIELRARNSSLYFRPENRIMADKLEASIVNGKTSLRLEHDSGKAVFVAEDGKFSFEGESLDAAFMEALLANSIFSGGTLSFTGSGDTKNFDARFKVQNTLLEN